MRYLTYRTEEGQTRAGVMLPDNDTRIIDLTALLGDSSAIRDIGELLERYPEADRKVRDAVDALGAGEEAPQDTPRGCPPLAGTSLSELSIPAESVSLCAPIRKAPTLRDFCAYELHVKRCGELNGIGIPPKWYQAPLFFFQNTSNFCGPEDTVFRKKDSVSLDYEAEIAMVIGTSGRNISREQALDHVFGIMIFNDWSDRDLCTFEVGFLGLHKAKDFASGFGPYIVTLDELAEHLSEDGKLNLKADAWVDQEHTTDSRTDDMHWSLPECISYASEDAWLAPGDIIGLGTISSGCIYEQTDRYPYLSDGATVTIAIEKLGTLIQYVGK